MRRLIATLIVATYLLGVAPRPASAGGTGEEAAVLAEVNAVRASRGLGPLEPHPELELKARAWAAHLASSGELAHSELTDGITADWLSLAENVAWGASADGAAQATLESPVHLANLVGPQTSHIGIGLASASGRVYLVEELMDLRFPKAPGTTSVLAVTEAAAPLAEPTPEPAPVSVPAPAAPPIAEPAESPPSAGAGTLPAAAAAPAAAAPTTAPLAAAPVAVPGAPPAEPAIPPPAVATMASAPVPAYPGPEKSPAGAAWLVVLGLLLFVPARRTAM